MTADASPRDASVSINPSSRRELVNPSICGFATGEPNVNDMTRGE
jgi:hypothetical protein